MPPAPTTTPTTKTEEPKPTTVADSQKNVRDALGSETMSLDDLRKLCTDIDIARAWAGGLIEFGHKQYCLTGPVSGNSLKPGSRLVLEEGFEWSGAKTKMHKPYRELINETPPKVEKFFRYEWTVPKLFGEEPVLRPVEISESEAVTAIALQVRLTDKGLGE
jgi:hypothetical protein